ncbi:hypothetical protein PQH03_08910 [Ralstonia insidiosa]|nr:hypothetical protein [Ralstonia insidiosa]KMW48524.1 hypothetical protein AC240_04235 [Ralstonia sp. MD27]MBX3770888.1 hypothetical protein [Ralstonia pickettii]NOZ18641.1 hypothetical protein [Betaproteobacteria bacterium]MBA9855044.1 hypothetical protein [Ralstonia insidiosa]MBA9872092.1 hypothetical protein [Ralstonia insidiosa]
MFTQRNPQFRTRSTLPWVALAMLLSAGASTALGNNLTPQTAGQISYVCGGVAQDEQQALNAEARNYNLSLLFTQGPRGEYLADVDVQITRHGKEVASFRADGPRCLIKAPPASYNVIATYQGTTKRVTVQTGSTRNVQLNW